MSIRYKTRAILGSAALAGVLAIGATAFTGGNTFNTPSEVVGTGSQTISGVTAKTVTYGLDGAGDNITSVGLVLDGDTTGSAIQIGFNGGNVALCSGSGTYAAGANETTYSCTGLNQALSTTTEFNLVAN